MVKRTLILLLLSSSTLVKAQEPGIADYKKFPLVLSIQFHALSFPLSDLKLGNLGIGIGTEVNWNKDHTLVQKFGLSWLGNRAVGDRLVLSSQFAWRPKITGDLFTEIKLGAAYLRAGRPTDSFDLVNGQWQAIGRRGKGLMAVPLGISLGYDSFSPDALISPFVSYDFMLVTGYSESIPLVPETLLQIGSRIHFK